ncbi:UNVERIFIED_CONTAM: hypothetical protein FKN15_000160 [Acipenser sinensis]
MVWFLKYLARQQAQPPAAAPALDASEPDLAVAKEDCDAISITASWEGSPFPQDEEEGDTQDLTFETGLSSETTLDAGHSPLPSSNSALIEVGKMASLDEGETLLQERIDPEGCGCNPGSLKEKITIKPRGRSGSLHGLKSKRESGSPRAQLSKLPGGRAYTVACAGAYRQLCYKSSANRYYLTAISHT